MKTNFAISATLSLIVLSHFICLGSNPVKDKRSNQVSTITEVSSNGAEKIVFDNNPPGGGNSVSSLRQSDIVGSLPGTAGVSPSGAATYTIPIWVSPGTNGMQPQLNITYNSGSGDGLMGIGWGISGLSAITRRTRDYMHDPGLTAANAYAVVDRFQLDGNLMVMLAGSYYAGAGTQYQTENQTFSNIIAVNNIPSLHGGAPESFLVYRKDGAVLQYGGTNDSRVEFQNGSIPLLWQLNKITDADGNFMEYEYYELNGESFIKEIRYTGNAAQGINTYASVNFEYANSSIPNTVYVGGVAVPHTKRLSNIYVKYGGNIIYKYSFNYGGGGFATDHLRSIVYSDANNLSINATNINWGATAPHMTVQTLSTTDFSGDHLFYPGDYNGDGIKDLVVVDESNLKEFELYLFDKTGHYSYACKKVYNYIDFQNAVVGDIDGDGIDEFITVYYSEYFINKVTTLTAYSYDPNGGGSLNIKGTGDTFYSASLSWFEPYKFFAGDFNGNGKAEVVLLNNETNSYDCMQFEFDGTDLVKIGYHSLPFDYLGKVSPCNFNGDQATDLMISRNGETRIIDFVGNALNYLYINGFPTEWHGILTGDFNGDGKTDLLTWDENSDNFSLSFSTGVLFTSQVLQPWLGTFPDDPTEDDEENNFIIGDYNGDGKDDIFKCMHYSYPQSGALSLFHSDGDGTFNQGAVQSFGYCINQKDFIPGDFNGDGKLDIFNHSATPVFSIYCANQGAQLIAFHPNEKSNLVEAITNGYDKTDNFSYAPLTELATNFTTGSYLKGSGAIFPVFDYQGPMHVVNKTWVTDPFSNIIDEKVYGYSGAKIHRQGRGFLCFEQVSSENTIDHVSNTITYGYDTDYYYPFKFRERIKKQTNPFTDFATTIYTNTKKTYSNGIFFPYVESKTFNDLLKNNTTVTTYDVNSDGNLTTQDETGTINNTSTEYTIHTENSYVSAGNGAVSTYGITPIPNKIENNTIVTTNTGEAPYTMYNNYTYYGNGDLQEQKTIPDNSSQYLLKHFDYDNSCGLSTTITVTGTDAAGVLMPQQRVTSYNYDNNYRFIEETTNPLSQISTKSYYAETGNVEYSIGVDLLGTRYIYDELGRIKEITTPRQSVTGSGTTQTFYEYANSSGNEPPGCSYKITMASPGSPLTTEYYDCFNRLMRTETEKLETAMTINKVLKDKKYIAGTSKISFESLPYYVGAPPVWNQYNYYTSDWRLESIIENVYGNSKTTNYSYNFNSVIIQKAGQATVTNYNMRGQVLSCYEANGIYVGYEYYSHGKPKSIGNGDSYSTMEYDAWANQILLNDMDAGVNTYEYNAFGELTKQRDASGNEFTMEYNALGQITRKTENPTGLIVTTSYTYKLWGNAGANNLESQTKSDGHTIVYKYDDSSSPTSGAHVGDLYEYTKSDGSVSLTTQYSYDQYGRVEFKTFPSQLQIKNVYNSIGNLIEIDDASAQPATILWSNPSENALGQPEGYNFGDAQLGIDAKFGYQDHFPSSREFRINGTPFWKENYMFNIQTGNLTQRSQPSYGLTEDFIYDTYDKQLEHVICNNGNNLDVIYGTQGKISDKSDVGHYSYDCSIVPCHAVKMLETPIGTAMPYSLNAQTIKYTAFNKPYYIEDDLNSPYHYNIYYGPDEERFKTDLENSNGYHKLKYFSEDYEYIPAGPLSAPQDRQLNYINSPYGIVAVVETDGTGNKAINYIGTDYLGSYNIVFDDNANILNEASFDAWGRARTPSSWVPALYSFPQFLLFDRGYTGHEHLQEFNLINMNGRMYDPFIGQMLSPDNFNNAPLSNIGLNRFAYAFNNPMKYTDPSGYVPTDGGYLPSSFYTSTSSYSYSYTANYTTYSYTNTTTTSTYNYSSTVNSGYFTVTYDNTLTSTTYSTQVSLSSEVYSYLNTSYATSYTSYSYQTSAGDYKLNVDALKPSMNAIGAINPSSSLAIFSTDYSKPLIGGPNDNSLDNLRRIAYVIDAGIYGGNRDGSQAPAIAKFVAGTTGLIETTNSVHTILYKKDIYNVQQSSKIDQVSASYNILQNFLPLSIGKLVFDFTFGVRDFYQDWNYKPYQHK